MADVHGPRERAVSHRDVAGDLYRDIADALKDEPVVAAEVPVADAAQTVLLGAIVQALLAIEARLDNLSAVTGNQQWRA